MQPPETSFEKAKSWVRELQRQADPGIVIMLVGNKLDLEASRKVSKEMGQQYAEEEGLLFAEASAKNGDGVEELFLDIGGLYFVLARATLTDSSQEATSERAAQARRSERQGCQRGSSSRDEQRVQLLEVVSVPPHHLIVPKE